MLKNVRSATQLLGRWLVPALALPSVLSCSAPANTPTDTERSFVETPSGRRVAFASPSKSETASALSVASTPFVIAKFNGSIPPAARAALVKAGYREVGYLPYDALLLERPAGAADVVAPGMVGFAPYLPEDRVSRELLPESLSSRPSSPSIPVLVHVMPGRDAAGARAAVLAAGGRIAGEGRSGEFTRMSVIFPEAAVLDAVSALAQRSEVFFLERIHHIGPFNDRAVGSIQSGFQGHDVAQTPIWQHGIRGQDQIVGVIDTGLDADSCYFAGKQLPTTNTWSMTEGYGAAVDQLHRKIAAYDFLYSCDQYPAGAGCETPTNLTQWDTQGHGTHVTGCMTGDSDSNPENYASADGVAPAARVVMQDAGYLVDDCGDLPGIGCPVISLEPIFEQSYKQGARAHNNSYGDNENAAAPKQSNYSARSADVDKFMWEHKDFLIVYAAGNSGAGNSEFSVGTPGTNKNGLSIGSSRTSVTSTSDDNMSSFSSRGWTGDGRIKPDIMAPGCNASAGNDKNVGMANCTNNSGCGTSYAAPIAVGAAALVRQYFVDGFYPSGAKNAADSLLPTAALVKAAMINSGVGMRGTDNSGGSITPIPSNEQGWGRIQLDTALKFADGTGKLLVDDHKQGFAAGATTAVTYKVTLDANQATKPFKVTLAWTDYPGMPDSPPAAPTVGDSNSWGAPRLVNNLDLSVQGPSGTYLGNVFDAGKSATGGSADIRNNVEQVFLESATAGEYTITVNPTAIAQGDQDFALVVTWGSPAPIPPPTTTPDAGRPDASVPDSGAIDASRSDGAGASGGAGGGDGAATGGAGGGGGAAGSGGAAGTTGGGAGEGGAAGTTTGSSGTGGTGGSDNGCSCTMTQRNQASWAHALLLGLPLLVPARRRSRHKKR